MIKRVVTRIMVLLLLLSALNTAFTSSVAETSDSESGLTNYLELSETADWWTMFRHDANHTGYSNSTLPIEPSHLWNTSGTIKGSVRSSVAIADGKIFVGSSDKKVYALDAATGGQIWSYSTNDVVESSPAVADGKVYVGSDDGRVRAYLASGAEVWSNVTGGPVKSSPAVADGIVFFGSLDGYVYAWNATNGNEIWRFWTACPIYSSPAVSGGRVFIGASDGRVYALSVTGRYEWHFDAGENVSSSPAVADGRVFVGSDNGKAYALNETNGNIIWSNSTGDAVKSSPAIANGRVFIGSMNGSVYALNATTGNILWNFPTGGFVYSSPAVAGDDVVVGSGDNRTYVLSAATGFQLWNYTTGGPIYSSPTVAKGMLFIGSDDKKVYAFGRKNMPPCPKISPPFPEEPFILQAVTFDGSASYDPDGLVVNCTWNFGDGTIEKYAAWELGKIVTHAYGAVKTYNVTLTVTDDYPVPGLRKTNATSQLVTVYEAWPMYRHGWNHKGYSTSLAPVTNGVLWSLAIGPDASSDALMYPSPVVVDGVVYISSTNGTVYALNAINRAIIWKWNSTPAGVIHSSPTVADGMVFVGSDDYNVYALNATNGNLVWKYSATGKVVSSATVAYGKVFVASRDGYLHALPEKDPNGDGIINSTERKWRVQVQGTPRDIVSSPAVADGKVFFGSLDNWIYALNATSGAQIIPGWPQATQGDVTSSPAVADGKVFVGSDDGKVHAYLVSGAKIGSFTTGGLVKSSPAVAYGKVFVGSNDGKIYALSTSGTHLWNKTIGSVSWSSPAVAEHKVFIGSANGIYAFREDGKEVWSYQTGGPFDSSPAIFNDTLYATSKKGVLYAFWSQTHDVAVTELSPSKTEVVQNQTITIAARVENQGSFNETNINVTAQYDGILFNSTSINLVRGEERLLIIPWNTTGINIGNYTISVNATLAPPVADNDTADNTKSVAITVEPGIHDIKATEVITLKGIVSQGFSANISVTVKNEGTLPENNINVIAYWSNGTHINQTIGSTIILELAKNASKTVSITWNTNATGVSLTVGNYTISAYAWPVADEIDITDNTRVDGTILVTILGDVSGDRKVDGRDIAITAKYFGSTSDYPPPADINNDGKVDGKDIAATSKNFGKKYP